MIDATLQTQTTIIASSLELTGNEAQRVLDNFVFKGCDANNTHEQK